MKKVSIFYFTGTGNSEYVAREIANRLTSEAIAGFSLPKIEIEVSSIVDFYKIKYKSTIHVFVFPVLGFGIPSIMKTFMKKMSEVVYPENRVTEPADAAEVTTTTAIVIPTMGGNVGVCFYLARKFLKNYKVINEYPVVMPANWTLASDAPNEILVNKILSSAQVDIENIAKKIMSGESFIFQQSPLNKLLYFVYFPFTLFGRRFSGKAFYSNENCNRCGLCASKCPNSTISMTGNGPEWDWNCEQCFKCMNICSQNAIHISYMSMLGPTIMAFIAAFYLKSNFINKIFLFAGASFILQAMLDYFPKIKRFGEITRNRLRYKGPKKS